MPRLSSYRASAPARVAGVEFHLGDLFQADRHVALAVGDVGVGGGKRAIVGEHLLIGGVGARIVLGGVLEVADLLERDGDVLPPFGAGLLRLRPGGGEWRGFPRSRQARRLASPELSLIEAMLSSMVETSL